MTTLHNHPESDDICITGRWCTECCELIPSEPGTSQTREIGAAVYHFCSSGCYQRWVTDGAENVDLN